MTPDEVVLAIAAAWNDRDLEGVLVHLDEAVVWDDPAMPAPAVGKDEVRAFSESVLTAFPDFHYEVRHPLCVAEDGSRCAVPWTITATHTAAMDPPGFAPTGRTARFQGVDLLEIRDGRVTRIDTLFNVVVAAEQLLGMELRPPPGSLRERVAVGAQRLAASLARLRGRLAPGE